MGHLGSAITTEADDKSMSIPFIVSVLQEDRDGDIVVPMGCQLENFARNPVGFFGHQQHPVPICKWANGNHVTVFPEENRIKAIAWFDKGDEDSVFIYGKVKRGFLNATSIAFVPIEAYRRDREEKELKAHTSSNPMTPPGWLFKVYDLTEISIVGVPSNAGAIRDSLDREKSFISLRLQKALLPYAAKAAGRSFSGWCPDGKCIMTTEKSAPEGPYTSAFTTGKWFLVETPKGWFVTQDGKQPTEGVGPHASRRDALAWLAENGYSKKSVSTDIEKRLDEQAQLIRTLQERLGEPVKTKGCSCNDKPVQKKLIQKVDPLLPSRSRSGMNQLPVRNIETIRNRLVEDTFRGDRSVEDLPEFRTWLSTVRTHYMEMRTVEERMRHRGELQQAFAGLIRAYERATGKKAKPLSEALAALPSDEKSLKALRKGYEDETAARDHGVYVYQSGVKYGLMANVDEDIVAASPTFSSPAEAEAFARREGWRVVRSTSRIVSKYITHDGDKWVVHAESGKVLGTHDSKASAERQLRAVESNKHKSVRKNFNSGDRVVDTSTGKAGVVTDYRDRGVTMYLVRYDEGGEAWVTGGVLRRKSLKSRTKSIPNVFGKSVRKAGAEARHVRAVLEGAGIEFTMQEQQLSGGRYVQNVRVMEGNPQIAARLLQDAFGYGEVTISGSSIRVGKQLLESSGPAGGYTVAVDQGTHDTGTPGVIACVTCESTGNCPMCGGTGLSGSADCPECGGSGECLVCMGIGTVQKSVKKFKIGDKVVFTRDPFGHGQFPPGREATVTEVGGSKVRVRIGAVSSDREGMGYSYNDMEVPVDALKLKSLRKKVNKALFLVRSNDGKYYNADDDTFGNILAATEYQNRQDAESIARRAPIEHNVTATVVQRSLRKKVNNATSS